MLRKHWEVGDTNTQTGIAHVFGEDESDAALIAASRQLIPRLLATVRELESALHELLQDTEHKDHDCGDAKCPVDRARKLLTQIEIKE